MATTKKIDIQAAQDAAERFLVDMRGFDILERNYSYSGREVEFIAKDENCIHFIELRVRLAANEGFEEQSKISTQKRRSLETLAEHYLLTDCNILSDMTITFDIISMLCLPNKRHAFIRLYQNILSAA